MPDQSRQLPLAFAHPARTGPEDFVVGAANRAARELVLASDWPAPVVVLIGPEGAGKSHLVAMFAAATGATVIGAADLDGFDPGRIGGGESGTGTGRPIVVEDLGPGLAERPLFHVLNAAREAGVRVLLTARTEPARWEVGLADLASRLRAATPVRVEEPDDRLLEAVLAKLFADRQTIVDPQVIAYLAVRIERSYAAAAAVVETLDREAMASKSPITRAVAARVVGRHGREPELPGLDDEAAEPDDGDATGGA